MSIKSKLTGEGHPDAPAPEMELLEHPSYIELQTKLTAAEEKASEYWDKLLRLQAEIGNTQRRAERDVTNAHKFALEKFVTELLPILDSLERAIVSGEEQFEGVQLTLKLFCSVLEKFGVEQINPENQPFNPEFHQAISTQVSEAEPNTVLIVMQKGYLLNGRLIRPALVIVSK